MEEFESMNFKAAKVGFPKMLEIVLVKSDVKLYMVCRNDTAVFFSKILTLYLATNRRWTNKICFVSCKGHKTT